MVEALTLVGAVNIGEVRVVGVYVVWGQVCVSASGLGCCLASVCVHVCMGLCTWCFALAPVGRAS